MPNVSPLKFVTTFHMRCDQRFLDDLDDLRARSRPILSRADFLRTLVAEAKARGGTQPAQTAKKRARERAPAE
jgi:hypothetical protein